MPAPTVRALGALLALAVLVPALPALPAAPADDGGAPPQIPCTDPRGCPDLITDPARMQNAFVRTSTFSASSCAVREGMVTAGTHKLLRWTFTTPNFGEGDLIVGSPSQHPEWFVYSDCHRHHHFREYADYRLWNPIEYRLYDLYRTLTPQLTAKEILAAHPELKPVRGDKAGFCVIDLIQYQAGAPSRWRSCGNQGISVGWADEYHWTLDGQWIVLDNVAPGQYVLENEVNAERLYEESNYANNRAAIDVTIS